MADNGNNPINLGASSPAALLQALIIQILAMPPVPGAPVAGLQYKIPARVDLKTLSKPLKVQVTHGQAVLTELTQLAATRDWSATFGSLLPTASQTEAVFRVANAWSAEQQSAELWAKTVRGNAAVSWDEVLKVIAALSSGIEGLLTASPDLAAAMPATVAFLKARSTNGQKAAQTRNAPKVARTKATKQQTQATHSATEAQAAEASEAILHPTAAPTANGASTGTPVPTPAPASTIK